MSLLSLTSPFCQFVNLNSAMLQEHNKQQKTIKPNNDHVNFFLNYYHRWDLCRYVLYIAWWPRGEKSSDICQSGGSTSCNPAMTQNIWPLLLYDQHHHLYHPQYQWYLWTVSPVSWKPPWALFTAYLAFPISPSHHIFVITIIANVRDDINLEKILLNGHCQTPQKITKNQTNTMAF